MTPDELKAELESTKHTIREMIVKGLPCWTFRRAWQEYNVRGNMRSATGDIYKAVFIELCSPTGRTYIVSSGEYRSGGDLEWRWSRNEVERLHPTVGITWQMDSVR